MTAPHLAELRREAFIAALPLFAAWRPGNPEPLAMVDGEPTPLSELCGLVWNDPVCLSDRDARALLASHGALLPTVSSMARFIRRRLHACAVLPGLPPPEAAKWRLLLDQVMEDIIKTHGLRKVSRDIIHDAIRRRLRTDDDNVVPFKRPEGS